MGPHIEPSGSLNSNLTGDRPRLEWEGPTDREPTLTSDLLRQLPLRHLHERAVRYEVGGTDLLESLRIERPVGRWTDQHYQGLARVYRDASGAPLIAIAECWHVSRAAASMWVKEGRARKSDQGEGREASEERQMMNKARGTVIQRGSI